MCTRHEVWSIESTVWNGEQSARVHKSPGAQIPVTQREAIVCEFLAQGNYAIARHHCDLNLQLCKFPDVNTISVDSLTN